MTNDWCKNKVKNIKLSKCLRAPPIGYFKNIKEAIDKYFKSWNITITNNHLWNS